MDSVGGKCLLLGGKEVAVSKLWLHAADLLKKCKRINHLFRELLVWMKRMGFGPWKLVKRFYIWRRGKAQLMV